MLRNDLVRLSSFVCYSNVIAGEISHGLVIKLTYVNYRNPLRRNYLSTKPSPAPLVLTKTDERSLEIIFQRLQK
jgi:hypothetical protein